MKSGVITVRIRELKEEKLIEVLSETDGIDGGTQTRILIPVDGDVGTGIVQGVRMLVQSTFGYAPQVVEPGNLVQEVAAELARACTLHRGMTSAHEGWAVIWEELDELWDEVKTNPKKLPGGTQEWISRMRREALQVAAMGLRFIKDVCDK